MAERVVPPTAQPARSREKAEAWAGSGSSGVVSSICSVPLFEAKIGSSRWDFWVGFCCGSVLI
ncbi:unnamed protein product [Prunus armeniaca]|uniref:Uncharacterized protein n=1 Tax=Prunus armeniaca TaxID=36596 RepID=A0A6J5XGF2_PRUAR|nr:unnamed protein product [Prunus armeniaca]